MGPAWNGETDIAIVGGGIAGCTLAIALATWYNVVLIDKLPEPAVRVGECLAPAARRILRKLDLLDGITQRKTGADLYLPNPGTQSYWGSDTRQVVDHLRNPDGLGWQLDRKAFEQQLRKMTSERGVRCCWGVKLHSSQYIDNRWQLEAKPVVAEAGNNTIAIRAKFVVDAGGRLSVFGKLAGVRRTHYDRLVAHWALLTDSQEMRMNTISASENGWWYSAPLPGNKRVMALHTDPDLAGRPMVKDAEGFMQSARANKEMAVILNAGDGPVHYQGVVAANSTKLDQVAGKQWAAVGDAAMSFDPLSSQGMFNAMAGALQLSELLINGKNSLDNPEHAAQLQSAYSLQIDHIWDRYTYHKQLFYSQEQRWKNAAFWQRRH